MLAELPPYFFHKTLSIDFIWCYKLFIMIDAEKYITEYISNPKEILLKELKSFNNIDDIKFNFFHEIKVLATEQWQDSGDDQNTFTGKILKIKVRMLTFLVYQKYSDISCDFNKTTSFEKIIDILD